MSSSKEWDTIDIQLLLEDDCTGYSWTKPCLIDHRISKLLSTQAMPVVKHLDITFDNYAVLATQVSASWCQHLPNTEQLFFASQKAYLTKEDTLLSHKTPSNLQDLCISLRNLMSVLLKTTRKCTVTPSSLP